jgi:hypothetical protein
MAAAPTALADSIAYEKGGNVLLANPDGSGQRPVTTSGGYSKPTQASDGEIGTWLTPRRGGTLRIWATIGGHRTNTLRVKVLPKRC